MTTATTYTTWNGVGPLDWYRVIHQAETIRTHYHLGLASVWGHIQGGNYDTARMEMDRVLGDIEIDLIQRYLRGVLWIGLLKAVAFERAPALVNEAFVLPQTRKADFG